MKFLLDTDHISILQKQSGAEFARLIARIAQVPRADLAFCIISFHEQVLGCHTYATFTLPITCVIAPKDARPLDFCQTDRVAV
jgi:hypothetical protein